MLRWGKASSAACGANPQTIQHLQQNCELGTTCTDDDLREANQTVRQWIQKKASSMWPWKSPPDKPKPQLPKASGVDYVDLRDRYPFENLVLKGGGAKGIAYIGACKPSSKGPACFPIVDYTGSIGYNTSRAQADLLAPLVGKSVHHIKNSKHLAEEMSTILIEEDDMFLSHDVVSLFTNTPIPEALDIIRRRLQEDRDLKNRTNLQVDDILELLSFIVTTTYFSFRGNIYQQKFGTAMGSPVSPVLANLFMECLEQQAMATVPVTCRPKLWKRYVDDVMEVVKRGAQQELTDHLNNTDPTGNIQFTYEEEEKGTLPFLDTLLVRKGDGSVKLLVYRKSTHTDQYLNFQSHHPLHQKLGVIRTLMDRCNAVVTEDQDKELETQHIKRALMRCGYPEWTFQKVEQQRRRKQTEKTKTSKQQEEKAKGMVLDEAGILPSIKRFAGTSAGAITAALLAIGMSPQEMLDELSQKNLMELLDPPVTKGWFSFMNWFPHIPGVPGWLTVDHISMAIAVLTGRGGCEGEEFQRWFGDILDRNLKRLHPDKKGLDKDITFDTLYHMLGMELCIVAYNMVYGNETYFHVKTTPMMKIQDAVRMSMSIPVVFKPYEGVPGFTFIDGGLAANYPLWAFDGWYLSMEKKDKFQERLTSMIKEDGDAAGEKIRRMFHPEYRRKERFDERNYKSLGLLLFSSTDREMYQEQFENRLDEYYKTNHKETHEDSELCKEYKEEMTKREETRKVNIKNLNHVVGDRVKKLIEDIEGKEADLPDQPDFPIKTTLISQDCAGEIFSEEILNDFLNTNGNTSITKEKAFEMLMLDENGELTTDRLRKIYENVAPLQLAKRSYLGHRVVTSLRQYYGTMLEFVGNGSGIDEEDIHRSVAINVDYVGTMDFGMSPQDMEFLMRQGAAATIAFLEEKKDNLKRALRIKHAGLDDYGFLT
ncbi:Hypp4630 [Branchiostoma lanceolatum]|uniref:Hypp4630 protein n=1 Tax=Branchiostoma lanceolatum TaxID=7740 RepID=A0A8K0AAN6_BRALA|nr:Hypp4630 [Branchiostoma lanceolatum]